MPRAPSVFTGTANVVAVLVLLTEFAMLRAPLLRSQVRLYAFQSIVVSALAAIVAGARGIEELYVLAALSLALKAIAVPIVVLRLMREARVELAGRGRVGLPAAFFLAIAVSIFGFFGVGTLSVQSEALPTPALGVAMAVVLVAFVIIIVRTDVISQAVGFFSLENGVSVASLVVASGLPLVVGVAFLFDLLVAVVVFGVLMRVHHGRTGTLSTNVLDRLRG
jgi:hydrogenase-4 component E